MSEHNKTREAAELAKKEVEALQRELAKLKEENARLEREKLDLQREINARLPAPEGFVEVRGALFKRNPRGGFEPDAYCKKCRVPMMSLEGELPFLCSQCNGTVNFKGNDVPAILRGLS